MKRLLLRLSILLVVIIIAATFVTPALAYTYYYTGWYSYFDSVYADFGMSVREYYESNTSSSIKLGYSYYLINNWGTHPYGTLGRLNNQVWYDNGAAKQFNKYVSIPPGTTYSGYVSLGYTTYSKQPMGAVMIESLACESHMAFNGMWVVTFWSNGSITKEIYP